MIIYKWNYSKNNGIKDNDMKDKNLMNPKEENLMELLWDEQRPLTTAEIGSVLKGKGQLYTVRWRFPWKDRLCGRSRC